MEPIYIDKSANVSDDAVIGEGTKVWINVQVRENSIIGSYCNIGKDSYIDTLVKIGDRCKIQNSVNLYSGVDIEDDVFIGPGATFCNDKVPRAFVKDWEVAPTKICKGVSIGANATILCGIKIGEYSMVGAGSTVTKDVPPYTLVLGSPAKPIASIDKYGNRIRNFD
ncbi:acyltransferase [Prochlorococcus marinus]|uniref:acyltransferase n=1 Tax=Prochlorococcus marinus TaxID=1219 RepID=UPI0022B4687F|nr:acyltransferase [Prochlorococcus marinus]